MPNVAARLSPRARETFARWHQMIATRDTSKLGEIIHADAVFRSPVAHTPYTGRVTVTLILQTAEQVFSNFKYHREFVTVDTHSVVLEFSAEVDDVTTEGGDKKALKGIDMIRFNDEGMIVEFEVMVRPASGVQALAAAMAARLKGRM
jgi:SnoaL-like domain